MKIIQNNPEVLSNSNKESKGVIHATATAYKIMFSGIYEHKVAAIVRELSCNAYDSHVEAGKESVPFTITLPNPLHMYFEIEDYGVGLDDEGVRGVFINMFDSTKTTSNFLVGCMGLGSKTPYSYTDVFTIVARKNGMERTYSAYIGSDGAPTVNLLYEKETAECNGVKISVPVKEDDIHKFKWEAQWVLSFFETPPIVRGDFDFAFTGIVQQLKDRGWVKFVKNDYSFSDLYHIGHWYAVMGGVCYRLNKSTLFEKFMDQGIEHVFGSRYGSETVFIHFDIGELEFAASRETLSNTEYTLNNLNNKIEKILKEFKEKEQQEIDKQENFILALKYLQETHGITRWVLDMFSYRNTPLLDLWAVNRSILQRYDVSKMFENDKGRISRQKYLDLSDIIYMDIGNVVYSEKGKSSVGLIKAAWGVTDKGATLTLKNISKRSVERFLAFTGNSGANIYSLEDIRDKKESVIRKSVSPKVKRKDTEIYAKTYNFTRQYLQPISFIDVSDNADKVYLFTNQDLNYGEVYVNACSFFLNTGIIRQIMKDYAGGKSVVVLQANSRNAKKIEDNNLPLLEDIIVKWWEDNRELLKAEYIKNLISSDKQTVNLVKALNDAGIDLSEWGDLSILSSLNHPTIDFHVKGYVIATMLGLQTMEKDLDAERELMGNIVKHYSDKYPMVCYALKCLNYMHSNTEECINHIVEYIKEKESVTQENPSLRLVA